MALTPITLLVLAAFICAIASALGKCPGWVVDILVVLVLLLMVLR